MTITFDPLYPGAHLEVARLGDIEVGRVMDEGKGAAWTCILPPVYTYQWTKARSIEAAREALDASVTRWLGTAGLVKAEQPPAAKNSSEPYCWPCHYSGDCGTHKQISVSARDREIALRQFGPCPCGCGGPRRPYGRYATDECVAHVEPEKQ